ncbi:MAG: trypsin-like peptidase domain-containing protein [Candidatus Anammoxibacter sp.]
MKLAFVHISGSKKGHTEVFEKDTIQIGTHPSCDLRYKEVNDKDICSFHAEITCNNDSVIIKDIKTKAGVFVNKDRVSETELKDGDLIGFGKDGPEICIRFVLEKDDPNIKEGHGQNQQDSEISFENTLSTVGNVANALKNSIQKNADLVNIPANKPSRQTKRYLIIIFLLILGGSVALFYLYFYKLEETSKRIQTLETQQSSIENIIEKYRKGVCFIQGSYYFVDKETGDSIRTNFNGTPITNNFTGTGFLINAKGLILTNRHVAEPTWRSGRSAHKHGTRTHPDVEIKFAALRAFFPEVKDPFPLEIVKVSEDADVAILKFEPTDIKLPVLNLNLSTKTTRIGMPVILLGYPAGINAIFGKADQEVVDELITLPVLIIAEELSKLNLIRPLVTQGHVTDITPDRIIYDAQTTFGGSGGPLININGNVIGINYGILRSFKGSNFAVPIKYGLDLIQK